MDKVSSRCFNPPVTEFYTFMFEPSKRIFSLAVLCSLLFVPLLCRTPLSLCWREVCTVLGTALWRTSTEGKTFHKLHVQISFPYHWIGMSHVQLLFL